MESIQQVWDAVLKTLKADETISDAAYEMWITCINPQTVEESNFVVFVHSTFQKNIIEQQYREKIEAAIAGVFGFDLSLQILCDEPQDVSHQKEVTEERASRDEFTFENFVVGGANEFAYRASQAVASKPASQYNPLFIYGDSGLGKTHLLHAIGNAIKKNNPNYSVLYVTGETFTNEMLRSLDSKSMSEFHFKFRENDVLLIDDVQFLANKERIQEEFFHTFDALYTNHKQIVLTSDRPPKEIAMLSDRLASRFESGLLADIQVPDLETRMLIIRRKAEEMEIHISRDVSEYIATQLKTNVRQLEGVVKSLKAQYLLTGESPSISAAQSAIRAIKKDESTAVSIDQILDEVARTTGISADDIKSNRSTAPISKARQTATFVIRELTGNSLDSIGKELGNRDHSTMTYAYNQALKRRNSDSSYKMILEDIIKNIKSR